MHSGEHERPNEDISKYFCRCVAISVIDDKVRVKRKN